MSPAQNRFRFAAPLGHGGIPAHDEFAPIAAALESISQPGDTLFVLPLLLDQWDQQPPTYIVYFPALSSSGQPGIAALIDFMDQHCQPVEMVPDIVFHGDAVIERCG